MKDRSKVVFKNQLSSFLDFQMDSLYIILIAIDYIITNNINDV